VWCFAQGKYNTLCVFNSQEGVLNAYNYQNKGKKGTEFACGEVLFLQIQEVY
jgi:hypothetical protein